MKRTILIAVGCASAASANDIHVGPGSSVQAAIDAATSGDRILIEPGRYVEQLDLLGKAVELVGAGGPTFTILDADHMGIAVNMTHGEGPGTILRSLTITGGAGNFGPGGVVTNGSPYLEDCIIRSNTGRRGAGVSGGSPTLVRCRIEGNTSSLNHGGGVYGAPTLIDCTVRDNRCTGAQGGGLYLTGGTASLTGCLIIENSAHLSGGRGGGVAVHSSATVTIDRCVIAGNTAWGTNAGAYAGGIWATPSTTITRSTIAFNHLGPAANHGGGVYGATAIRDCIVYGNESPQIDGGVTASFSLVEGGAPGNSNIDSAPLFWDGARLDLHLMPGSPCIDAGDPASPLDPNGTRADMGAFPFDATYAPGPIVECVGAVNSTGQAASMGYTGSWSLSAGDLALRTAPCPASAFGVYFMGADPLMQAVSQGFLCINGPLTRLPVGQADANGTMHLPFVAQALPAGAPVLVPGSTWRFQLWYRDVGSTSRFSDALAVTFVD